MPSWGGERLKTEDYKKSLASLPRFSNQCDFFSWWHDLLPLKTHIYFSLIKKKNQNKGIWPLQIKDAYNKDCQVKHSRTMRY